MTDSELDPEFNRALEHYKSIGGIVKIDKDRLIYPGKQRLEQQLTETEKKKKYYEKQLRTLRREYNKAAVDNAFKKISKNFDPLYWQHMFKLLTDKEYKSTTGVVDPPIDYLKEPRWRAMVKMFVKNKEYRERLLEARTSELGKTRDSITRSIENNMEFMKNLINTRIEKINNEKKRFDNKSQALKGLIKYAE